MIHLFKSLHHLHFLSKHVLFISVRCWQLRLKISKNKHSSEHVTQDLSYCHSLMGLPRVTEPPLVWASVVWERGTWSKQSHPSVFFKLLRNRTCNYTPYPLFNSSLQDSCNFGGSVFSSYFLPLTLSTTTELSRRICYQEIWLFKVVKTDPIFFGNSNKWSQ